MKFADRKAAPKRFTSDEKYPAFIALWSKFSKRGMSGNKALTGHWNKLLSLTIDEAINALIYSIEGGWRGIHA